MDKRPVYALLEEAVAKYGNAEALFQPLPGGKGYKTWTWPQFREVVQQIATGLRSIGVPFGAITAIASETCAEFFLADFGAITAGCGSAAVYVSATPADQVKSLRIAGAKTVFVQNEKMLTTLELAGANELGITWILMNGFRDGLLTMDELIAKGKAAMEADPTLFERIRGEVKASDRAILYLTSGATGDPKMVEVSHGAITVNVDMANLVLDFGPKDRALAFLPSAHIAQRLGVQMLPIRLGMPIYFSESLSRLPLELRSVRPTFFLAPPRLWERIYSSIRTEVQKKGGLARKLFYMAVGLGAEAAAYRQRKEAVPLRISGPLKLFDKLVFQKIRDRFGGQMRMPISGAAPLATELAYFYAAIGMPLVEGFGLTEAGILVLNSVTEPKIGSIGRALPGVELVIADDGELLVRAPCMGTGYFNAPEATAQVWRDGWLYTGDLATIDEEGFVAIIGRKKEMIVSSNGKKIYPAKIEALFKMEPLINGMVLAGEQQPYVSALFTINAAAAEQLDEGLKGKSLAEISKAEVVQKAIKKAVQKANTQLAQFEQVRKFRLLENEFTIEGGELTPSMKIRKSRILEKYKHLVDEMYVVKDDLI